MVVDQEEEEVKETTDVLNVVNWFIYQESAGWKFIVEKKVLR